jgi:hypothetical protein
MRRGHANLSRWAELLGRRVRAAATGTVFIPTVGTIQVTSNDRWITTLAARFGVTNGWFGGTNNNWLFYGKAGVGWVGNDDFTITNLTTGASITPPTTTPIALRLRRHRHGQRQQSEIEIAQGAQRPRQSSASTSATCSRGAGTRGSIRRNKSGSSPAGSISSVLSIQC